MDVEIKEGPRLASDLVDYKLVEGMVVQNQQVFLHHQSLPDSRDCGAALPSS
jgi:hypothetical protein